jgi:hypothetical protein
VAAVCVAALAAAAVPAAAPAPALAAAGRVDAGTTERVSYEYVGARDYYDVLFNIEFNDVASSWARGAIYEGGALGIIKGFGSPSYGGSAALTKAQAIALALRAAGLEAVAQIEGEAIEAANRRAGYPPSDSDAVWINGSLKVAADMGLISAEDYGAGLGDAAAMTLSAFRRGDAAERQEFAYWIARALNISPVRGQEALFIDYTDWRSVDSLYAPYIEAILREKIMSGDLQGRINPRDAITREQAAQVVKNASKYVYKNNGFTESNGTIEKIETDVAAAPEGAKAEVRRTVYYIRNDIGLLDTITTQYAVSDSAGAASAGRRETGLVVIANGAPEDETVLSAGDRIRYISAKNRTPGYPDEIRYVELLRSEPARSYFLAQIDAIDAVNRRIAFTQIFPVDYSSAGEVRRAAESPQNLMRLSAEYIYEEGVVVKTDGAYTDISGLAPGMTVIIGIENFRNLFFIETSGFGYHLGEAGVARGVIEENNPVLGFVTLYSESGDRTNVSSLGAYGGLPELMIYNYSDASAVDVAKDGVKTTIDGISAGDSAFVRFDENGELTAISAVTNYKERYGTIISVQSGSVLINFNDAPGVPYSLELGNDVLYFKDFRLVGKSAVTAGSAVRVLLQDVGGVTAVREMTVMHEGDRGLVANIYKAMLSRFDETSNKAVLYNVQRLVKGRWERVDRKGFDALAYDSATRVYLNDMLVSPSQANKYLRENEVYIASKHDYGGVEVAAQINVHGADDKEQLYDGALTGLRRPAGAFGLTNGPSDIASGDWTIFVKDGKLISAAAIEQDDLAYVVANRADANGRLRAARRATPGRPQAPSSWLCR